MTCRCCLVALLILAAGCSSYRRVLVPGTEGMRDGLHVDSDGRPIATAVGSYVRVKLASDETVSGELAACGVDSLTLVRPRNYAFEQRMIAVGDVKEVHVLEEGGGRIRFTPAGIALTAVIATFLLAVSQIRWQ
jgi:hypothetical protein